MGFILLLAAAAAALKPYLIYLLALFFLGCIFRLVFRGR